MNIIISPYDEDTYYFRSDSTFIRAITDYYIPDYVRDMSVTPMLIFRIDRAGKAISEKFAIRYFGPFTYGFLLKFTIDEKFGGSCRTFMENSMDYSTIAPKQLEDIDKYSSFLNEDHPLLLNINGREIFRMDRNPRPTDLYRKFSIITDFCSVRTGDFLAFELNKPTPVTCGHRLILSSGETNFTDLIIR